MKSKNPFDRFGSPALPGEDKIQGLKDMLEGKKEAPVEEKKSPEESHQTNTALPEALEKIKKLEEDCLKEKEKYVRTLAEFENFRKRMEKEKEESIRYGNERILKEFLPVYDHLEMTVAHANQNGEAAQDPLVEGVVLVLKQFIGLLEKAGFQVITGVGLPFNPHHQEAIAQVETKEQKEGTVVDVHRKGFMLHGRVVRPALVSIAKEPLSSDNNSSQKEPLLH